MKEKIQVLVLLIFFISVQIAQAGDDWVQKNPSSKPSARENHAMSYIGDDKVLLYGGWTDLGKNGETWIYDLSENKWTQQSPINSPGIRTDHAMAYLGGDKVLMFGGSDVNYTWTSSCWIYDLSDNTWTDTEPLTRPGSRRYNAMAYIEDGKVLMVGGQLESTAYTGETWIYDLVSNTWTEKLNLGYGIFKHSICYIGGDQVLLAGIRTSVGVVDDSYIFDLSDNSWTQKSYMPSARAHGDMVYMGDNKAMFFGGYDNGYWHTNTTYISSSTGTSWSTDANSTNPSVRINHRIAETSMDGSSFLLLFGGDAGGTRNDETWTFGGGDVPLPIELNSFNANISNRNVILSWETEAEVNNYGFEVERSLSGHSSSFGGHSLNREWEIIGFVQGHGNANSQNEYSFIDENVAAGNYLYRLKQIDNDGKFTYSKVVEVTFITQPSTFELYQNYPNPFNPITRIDYQLSFNSEVKIELYSITGERVAILVNQPHEAGYYSIEVNTSKIRLASGVYVYRMVVVNNLKEKAFNQIKKLVVLK